MESSHPLSSLFSLMTSVISCPPGAACRRPSVMDQSRASDRGSHQDAGSNESHIRQGKKWLVMISRTKIEATCFSRFPKRGKFILQINGQEIHQQDAPTYLRVELDRKLTWSAHISIMHSKGLRKMALMKKLAGTKHENLDPGLYHHCQTPHGVCLQCLVICCRTNLDQLTKTQNAGLRIVAGGMKTTPVSELERTAGLLSLEKRREENCAKAKR